MVLGAWGTENHLIQEQKERDRLTKEIKTLSQEKTVLKQQTASLKQQTTSLEQRQVAINLLTQKLIDAGKIDELKKSSIDETYQIRLLEEYNLI